MWQDEARHPPRLCAVATVREKARVSIGTQAAIGYLRGRQASVLQLQAGNGRQISEPVAGAIGAEGGSEARIQRGKTLEKRFVHFVVILADARPNPGEQPLGWHIHRRNRRRENAFV